MYLWRFLDFFGWPRKPQIDPKIVKTAKFSDFYRFYAIFVKFSIDFVALNVEEKNFVIQETFIKK